MGSFYIDGGIRLRGEVAASGGKNAALPMMAAALLSRGEVIIENCPDISDVSDMTEILHALGAEAQRQGGAMAVHAGGELSPLMPEELSHRIRSSIFLLAPLVARCGEARLYLPGGCEIGRRPIDQHIAALSGLGAVTREEGKEIHCKTSGLKGGELRLAFPSVGTTENALLAAVLARGVTVIRGAAREPEIICLAGLIRAMGGRVSGEGSSVIRVEGVKSLHGAHFRCIPDRIEACTVLAGGAVTHGEVTVTHTDPGAYKSVTEAFRRAGAEVREYSEAVRISMPGRARGFDISTAPFPGFPTDMQAQMCALACTAEGESHIKETIFESRFRHARFMAMTGAEIKAAGGMLTIVGKKLLRPAHFVAQDLRGGAALTLLALACEGRSRVDGTEFIDRGYRRLEDKLRLLGGRIRRV